MAKSSPQTVNTSHKYRKPVTLLFVIGCFFSISYLYLSHMPVYVSVPLAFASLIVAGMVIANVNQLQGGYGLYMFGGTRGIGVIDSLSRTNRTFWKVFSEWGAAMSFGLLSYLIFRKSIDKRTLALGIISLLAVMILLLPNILLSFKFIDIPGVSSLVGDISTLQGPILAYPLALYVITVFGGFFLFMIALIALEAFGVISSIGAAALGAVTGHPNTAALSQQIPGLVPVIPGITIPFFAGIFALAVILIVHEFSHGVFARSAKIKIKRIGLILFGIIPIGAFVEPDEKQVERLDKDRQNDIYIAGIAANFLFTIFFFALTALMILYVMPLFFTNGVAVANTLPGYPAYNVIAPGSLILTWNGQQFANLGSFESIARNDTPFSTINVVTNNGQYTFKTNATGKIGVELEQTLVAKAKGPQNGLVNFFYAFFVLAFVLNFLVATINLLPVPAFDGWRIYKNRIKSRKILLAMSALTIIGLIILALPWIWA